MDYCINFNGFFWHNNNLRKILKLSLINTFFWILERWDGVMWTGLVWLRIGTGGELL
jgi:hypothetical protein